MATKARVAGNWGWSRAPRRKPVKPEVQVVRCIRQPKLTNENGKVSTRQAFPRNTQLKRRRPRDVSAGCWSLEVSAVTATFVIGTVATLLLRRATPRDTGNAIFLGVFGSMQIVDLLLWMEEKKQGLGMCSFDNRLVTRIGLAIILLEPIAALIGTCVASKQKPTITEIAFYASLFVATPLAATTIPPDMFQVPCAARIDAEQTCSPEANIGKWSNILLDVDSTCACSTLTDDGKFFDLGDEKAKRESTGEVIAVEKKHSGGKGHIMYGGQDLIYHGWLLPRVDQVQNWVMKEFDAIKGGTWVPLEQLGEDCVEPLGLVEGTKEIPILMRLAFLLSMAVPYATKVKPVAAGLSNASILVITWLFGYFSDSHASVWCLANVGQGLLMLADPYIWPPHVSATEKLRAIESDTEKSQGLHRRKEKRRLFKEKDVPENLDAIVIGSGIGGLCCAALLAKAGKKVLVLEKHYRPGGCTHAFTEVGDNQFDSGIHYVGGGSLMKTMLGYISDTPVHMAAMGSEQDGYLYDTFDLGDQANLIEYRKGRDALVSELLLKFPEERDGIVRYVDHVKSSSSATDTLMYAKFVPKGFPFRKTIISALYRNTLKYAKNTAEEEVKRFVKDKKLQALLAAGQMIDWNLPPGEVSWLVSAGMMNYYMNGGFYPVGGSNTIVECIIPTIEKAGGKVFCNASVSSIHLDEKSGHATGVTLKNGKVLYAPCIVSAAGYSNTFERMLTPETLKHAGYDLETAPMRILQPSHSHVCAFISLDGPSARFDLHPWNIHSFPELPKYDYDITRMQKEFYRDPFSQKEPLITLTCPSAKDPAYEKDYPNTSNVLLLAEGMQDWFAGMPDVDAVEGGRSTHGKRSEEYKALKGKFKDMFLERLFKYYPKTRGHVSHIELSTPLTSAHFLNSPKGASYGLEWTPAHFDPDLQETWFHPVTKIPGLYLSGEQVGYGGFYGALATGFATAVHVLGVGKFLALLVNSDLIMPKEEKK